MKKEQYKPQTHAEMSTLNTSMRKMLEGRHYATLATHNADGSIHVTPVWYLFDHGQFYVELPSKSCKARNAARRPNATIMVDVRRPGCESWVYASGHVEILTGDESQQTNARIRQRYLTEEALQDPRIGPALAAGDDITLCLVPDIWRFWSARDADERKFGGLLGRTPDKWFRPMDD